MLPHVHHQDRVKACDVTGADVKARNSKGRTALMLAAYWGHSKVVRVLLEKGAVANDKDNYGNTALDFAQAKNQASVVDELKKQAPQQEKR